MRFILSVCLAATCAIAQSPGKPASSGEQVTDLPEILNYTITMEKVDKWAAANRAVIPYQIAHLNDIKNKPDPPANLPHTMEAMAKWTKANYPEHVRLVENAGISFKEYLIMAVALQAAMSAESAISFGKQPDVRVGMANIAFAKANKAKLSALFGEFQQLMAGHPIGH
jgi:hypothetical protein